MLSKIIRVDSLKAAHSKFQQARCEVKQQNWVRSLNNLEIAFEYNPTLRDILQSEMNKPINDWAFIQNNWYLNEVLLGKTKE